MRLYVLPVVLVVCGAVLSAMAELSVPAQRQEFAAPIDFEALRAQANGALETLRQSRARRLAGAVAGPS